jgi:transposase
MARAVGNRLRFGGLRLLKSRYPPAGYGSLDSFSPVCFCAMELITILNRCHHFQRFVYHRAKFGPDHRSIEVSVRPRKASAAVCSRCHQPGPGYDQLAERRFEFIPVWGFFVFLL